MTVTRLTVLPCKSNLRMLVGGGVPSRVQLLLPTHRPANLTVGIRISLPAARRLFLSFSHNNQLSPSHLYLYLPAFDFGHPLSFTKSFSKLQLHSLNQLYLFFQTTTSIFNTSFTSSTHKSPKCVTHWLLLPWLALPSLHPLFPSPSTRSAMDRFRCRLRLHPQLPLLLWRRRRC